MPFYVKKMCVIQDKRISESEHATPEKNKRAYLSAVAVVEASLVIPLFIYAVIAVVYMLQIINIKSRMEQALYNDARQLSKYSYMYELQEKENISKIVNYTVAHGILIKELGVDFAKNNNIVGGIAGIIMAQSEILDENNIINLTVSYAVKNPLDIFGIHIMRIKQTVSTAAWLGEEQESDIFNNRTDSDRIVYIVPEGEVYHEDKNCTYLNMVVDEVSISEIGDIRNVSGSKYYSCEKCSDNTIGGNVYITAYGERYHADRNCSSLRRIIMEIPFSKVENRRPCSKCSQ